MGCVVEVAPMLDYTDKHFRFLCGLIDPNAILYTEMVVADTLIHNPNWYPLDYAPLNKPPVLQLGGSNPHKLSIALTKAVQPEQHYLNVPEGLSYQAFNLNVGCPSSRVQSGEFGACLMLTPKVVVACVQAMQDTMHQLGLDPVQQLSVKCRLGVDEQDTLNTLPEFVYGLHKAGLRRIIIHARKAWLNGLSPKENRTIPPICWDEVYAIKKAFPDMVVILNGEIKTPESVLTQLGKVDGVMLGRAVTQSPMVLGQVRAALGGVSPTAQSVLSAYLGYLEANLPQVPLRTLLKPVLNMYHAQPKGKLFRQQIDTLLKHTTRPLDDIAALFQAYS